MEVRDLKTNVKVHYLKLPLMALEVKDMKLLFVVLEEVEVLLAAVWDEVIGHADFEGLLEEGFAYGSRFRALLLVHVIVNCNVLRNLVINLVQPTLINRNINRIRLPILD